MRAVIFANGEFQGTWDRDASQPDLIIAADGGSLHCRRLGLRPDVIIGDLDSLNLEEVRTFEAAGVKVMRYPTRKDYTDLELALLYSKEQGCTQILVLGALGSRWDQSLANLLLPASASFSDLSILFVDGPYEIQLLRSRQTLELTGKTGDTLSLIPIGGDALGISTRGLEYPLSGETLFFGATRGVSNNLTSQNASIYLENGFLLCVIIHQ